MDCLGIPQPVTASALITIQKAFVVLSCFVLTILSGTVAALPQTPSYPKEIRGYKVERTVVEVRKPDPKNQRSGNTGSSNAGAVQADTANSEDVDALIQLGKPKLSRVTPLGITFEVPLVVAPVKQSGHVDFLVFEDMVVNGTSVNIDEYQRPFDLPNKQPLTLGDPLSIYIYLPSAMLAALGDWNDSKETWPVTGRVYVFGKFKKSVFTFKRVIPVELKVTMQNPLKAR